MDVSSDTIRPRAFLSKSLSAGARAIALIVWNLQNRTAPIFGGIDGAGRLPRRSFLLRGGVFVGTVKHLRKEEREYLTVEAVSTEAVTTSEIEGEILDRASIQKLEHDLTVLSCCPRFGWRSKPFRV